MLVEFRVSNFRSLRDEQILSLVASKDKVLKSSNTIPSGMAGVPTLLCSAAIYGSNASGKSNLIKAIQYMRGVVIESAAKSPGESFNVQPFKLDKKFITQPTEFEATFIIDGVRYQYGFALTSERITKEYLLVYKTSKPQKWFSRNYDPQTDTDLYDFGSHLKGQKSLWVKATRSNALLLSMAVQLNNDQLRPIFDLFMNKLIIYNHIAVLNPLVSIQMLQNPQDKKLIYDFISTSDISITDINVIKQTKTQPSIHYDQSTRTAEVRDSEIEGLQLQFHHATENGTAIFDIVEESQGTQHLLFLAGPILKVLSEGLTLIIDELENSLHPLLVRRLVELFHSSKHNKKGAQLIFTTHNTSLLDSDILRRDQIWFVEKNEQQASIVFPLSDFSPRKNEAFERSYLIGRFGAIPFFNDWDGVEE